MTIRQNILNNVQTTLQAIPDFKSVDVNKIVSFDAISKIPALFIQSGSDEDITTEGAIGDETWQWGIDIQLYSVDTAIEDLIGKVHLEMLKDPSRGGFAFETKLTTREELNIVDVPRAIYGIVMHYSVRYSHKRGIV